jgi:hypothetical protein
MRQITQLLGGSEDAPPRQDRPGAAHHRHRPSLRPQPGTDIEATGPLDNQARAALQRASSTLHQSLNVVVGAISGRRDVTYTRSSALFDRAERDVEQSDTAHHGPLPIRDLKLIDATMAEMAELMGLPITDYDTIGAA